MRTTPNPRRVTALVAAAVAVMLAGCGTAPYEVDSPTGQDSPTTDAKPVDTSPVTEKPDLPGNTLPQPVFDPTTTTIALPVATLQPPKNPVPLQPGDLAPQFIGQIIQLDQNAKEHFIGNIALPPGSYLRGGGAVMGADNTPINYGVSMINLADRSKTATSLAVMLIRPEVGGTSPGPGIGRPAFVVDAIEILLATDQQLVSWDCLVDGKPDFNVLALAKDGRGTVRPMQAWRIDPTIGKIVEIDPTSVICELSQV